MKILAIADRPPRKGLKELVEKEGVDLIVTLGDLEYLQLVELNNINIPKIGVYGNHCSGNYFNDLGIKDMHLQTFEFGGLTFGGFEGSHKYKEDEYAKMYTQDQAKELLKNFPYVDVFLSHSPPKGTNDEDDVAHVGLEALRTYVEEKKPRYFFHGHTYPKKGEEVTRLGDTEIIYVQGDKIVNLSDGNKESEDREKIREYLHQVVKEQSEIPDDERIPISNPDKYSLPLGRSELNKDEQK